MHNTQVCGPHVELTGRRLRMALQSSRWPEITGNLARVIQLLKLDGILGNASGFKAEWVSAGSVSGCVV
jgi:hypothetical protein